MMAYRIAWYKVFQPLAYYAAYFSIRATAFSYEMMCMGKERLEYYMAEIRKKGDSASKKRTGYPEGYAYCTGNVRTWI